MGSLQSIQERQEIWLPSVSIAIPTYNESQNIEKVIKEFLSTDYPNLIEIIVTDGGSTDGTQEIVNLLSQLDSRVKLLDNPMKLQAYGLNLVLAKSEGLIFLRADAHSDYAPDYISRCVEVLLETKAFNVGGATRLAAKKHFQAGVALASRSLLGGGHSKHRNEYYEGYTDTLFPGCFWKETLQSVSGYRPEAISDEDADLNLRLQRLFVDRKSEDECLPHVSDSSTPVGAVFISPKIQVWYYPRSTWISLLKQYFKYGRGRCLTALKYPALAPARVKLPFLIFLGMIVILMMGLLVEPMRVFVGLFVTAILLLMIVESFRVAWHDRNILVTDIWRGNRENVPPYLSCCFYIFVALSTMLLSYFVGYSYQFLKINFLGVKEW